MSVVDHIECNSAHSEGQKSWALQHIQQAEQQQDPHRGLSDVKPWNLLATIVLLGQVIYGLIEFSFHLLLLLEVWVVTCFLFLLLLLFLQQDLCLGRLNVVGKEAKWCSQLLDEDLNLPEHTYILADLIVPCLCLHPVSVLQVLVIGKLQYDSWLGW